MKTEVIYNDKRRQSSDISISVASVYEQLEYKPANHFQGFHWLRFFFTIFSHIFQF